MEQKGLMDKEIGDRTINEYIVIIKTPLMWLIGLSILSFLIGLPRYLPGIGGVIALLTLPFSLIILIVSLVIGGYIGYITVKKYSGNLLTAAVAGALAGAISGLVGAVLGLFNAVLSLAFAFSPFGGAFIMTEAVFSLITSPILGAIVGAILSVIGGVVAGSSSFESKKAKK